MEFSQRCGNVVEITLHIQRKYNVILRLFEHVGMQRCTLPCDNIATTSFLQRCESTTLHNVVFTLCVGWGVLKISPFLDELKETDETSHNTPSNVTEIS